MGEGACFNVGVPYYLPHTAAIPHIIYNPIRTLLLYWPQGLGEKQKVCNDIAFLLVLAREEAIGERKYGLSTIWVNACQARVCSMEEVVKELTAWVSSGLDWPYTLVWLNKDTCHAPLPKEGHLGILAQGGTDMTGYRRISQLEVCQLLVSGLQVAYPVGLNGCEDPIIISLPESLANSISLTGGGSIYLEIDILQPMAEELDWKVLPPSRHSHILIASPIKTTPPKPEREVSMTMEVTDLLSWVMVDMPGHMSRNSMLKILNPIVVLTPPPHNLRGLFGPVDTLSQVSTRYAAEVAEASLEETPTISSIAKTPGPCGRTPPTDASYLQEKANKALGELLVTKSSINAHRQKAVWELGMKLHHSNSEMTESIKTAQATYAQTTQDTKALCPATVKEAKATCTHTIWEAKALCSLAIRDAEIQGAAWADLLHWEYTKTIQQLEEQVIQEEGESQIDFLSACQATMHACPLELQGTVVTSYHILMGQTPTSHQFIFSQGTSP